MWYFLKSDLITEIFSETLQMFTHFFFSGETFKSLKQPKSLHLISIWLSSRNNWDIQSTSSLKNENYNAFMFFLELEWHGHHDRKSCMKVPHVWNDTEICQFSLLAKLFKRDLVSFSFRLSCFFSPFSFFVSELHSMFFVVRKVYVFPVSLCYVNVGWRAWCRKAEISMCSPPFSARSVQTPAVVCCVLWRFSVLVFWRLKSASVRRTSS